MKKTLFLMTHEGSLWGRLKDVLEQNPKVHVFQTGIAYKHYEDLEALWDHCHRNDNAAAWWVDVITENKNFTYRELAKYCKFYYFVNDACHLGEIGLDPINAAAYYRFRMKGLSQWHKRTGGPWANYWKDLTDPSAFRDSIGSFIPDLVFDYEFDDKAREWRDEVDCCEDFPPALKKECHEAFVRYTPIVRGNS